MEHENILLGMGRERDIFRAFSSTQHFAFHCVILSVNSTFSAMQEYVANKTKKTEERRKAIEDINAVIQQIYKDQDLTQGLY